MNNIDEIRVTILLIHFSVNHKYETVQYKVILFKVNISSLKNVSTFFKIVFKEN